MPKDDLIIKDEVLPGGEIVVIRLEGQLDNYNYEPLNTIVQKHFDATHYKLIFDLGRVVYIASTSVGIFLAAIATAEENGGGIVIVNPTIKVKVVFESFGLMQMFKVSDTVQAAMSQF